MIEQVGVYEVPEGAIFKVQRSGTSGHLYAKRLTLTPARVNELEETVGWDFEYAPGAVRSLTPEMQLTVERAMELSIKYERCISCGRTLKAEKSVRANIGPVCIKYFRR